MDSVIYFIRRNYTWIIPTICLLLFISLAEDVFEQEIMKCDLVVYEFFVNTIRNDLLTSIMKIITNFGSAIVLVAICIISFIVLKNKRIGICITSNLVLITILNQIFKFIVQRPRPEGYRLITESGYSFPSGHSMISMAFYGYIIYLVCRFVKNEDLKSSISIILSILIVLIGSSRIYLGVHYASDVLAGALISGAYLVAYIKSTKYLITK